MNGDILTDGLLDGLLDDTVDQPDSILDVMPDSEYTVGQDEAGQRVDKLVSEKESLSRSLVVKLIEGGMIFVNGGQTDKNYKTRAGDLITVRHPAPTLDKALPEDIPLDIVYEDADIIVINKPSGMIVHPATGIYTGTLVNALLYHCKDSLSGIGGVLRPGIVHRIDKDTSGLLVVAKNDAAHLFLSEALKEHKVSRIYHAIVLGNIRQDRGTVDKPIGRHPTDRKRMAVITDPSVKSRDAVTHFSVIERFQTGAGCFTHIKCELETGRTHQIRVHMSSMGHPILGDPVYGGDKTKLEAANRELFRGQFLHAKQLSLTHPRTCERMLFECELPEQMEAILGKLRAQSY